jgi:hypothetical protein
VEVGPLFALRRSGESHSTAAFVTVTAAALTQNIMGMTWSGTQILREKTTRSFENHHGKTPYFEGIAKQEVYFKSDKLHLIMPATLIIESLS